MNSIPMSRKPFSSEGSSFPSIDAYGWAPAALSEVVVKRAFAAAMVFVGRIGRGCLARDVGD